MSNREYEHWYEKLVRSGYTPAAAHARATKLGKLVDDQRITTACVMQTAAREHDARVYTLELKRMIGAGFPPDLAEERADREAREATRRMRQPKR